MVPGGRERPQYGKPYLHVFVLKKIFSRISWLISFKLGTNRSWVKDILNCSNLGPGPFHSGDNSKNGWGHLKIFFSQTSEPEELIFT
jgi:hypothetical protein